MVVMMVHTLGPPRYEKVQREGLPGHGAWISTKANATVPPALESQSLLSFVAGEVIHFL